ncbi:MAG: NAD(P)-dependent oxidoreductase [Gammaproteobacteria bacterium]|nr:NAD(P)-dependent oxidoreductase [Gammaproteobacteria bacterium]
MAEKINVGYIGLGNIGKPSARHLIGDSYQAHVYDVYQPAVDELVELGAHGCASPAELARACVQIGICVRDDSQVEDLLYAESGLLENAAAGTIIAIHSTVTQAGILKWAADAQAKQIKLIDAPITGGASGAEAASLCYMVGGDEATVAAASPVFETSADKVVHAGVLGTGIILKLCNNLITYAEFMAMSEAPRLAEAGGLSAEVLREVGKANGVINESMYKFASNRNALAQNCSEEQMEEFFGPFGRLGEKDLDCALQSASDLGISLPSTASLRKDVYNLFMNKA